jgi:hypothetical protein
LVANNHNNYRGKKNEDRNEEYISKYRPVASIVGKYGRVAFLMGCRQLILFKTKTPRLTKEKKIKEKEK